MEDPDSFTQKRMQLGKHWMILVRAIEDLVPGLDPKNETHIRERDQLALNGPNADIDTASDLSNEESLVGSSEQGRKDATSRAAEENVPKRSVDRSHFENNCTQYENSLPDRQAPPPRFIEVTR